MARFIFVAAFLATLLIHGFGIIALGMYDVPKWGNQAWYVEHGDPQEFDTSEAYGHPGGTLIIGTIFVQKLTGSSYFSALEAFLAVADSLVIAAICALCYVLRRSIWWCASVCLILAANPLNTETTPPSMLASLLVVLLALFTLRLYEIRNWSSYAGKAWIVCAGLLMATRLDIGLYAVVASALFLIVTGHVRKTLAALPFAAAVFVLLDPFMWFMPIRHLTDMVQKFAYHFADYVAPPVALPDVISWSFFGIAGLVIALATIRSRGPLPRSYALALAVFAAFGFAAFFASEYQAIRYLQPFIFLWEILLPLYLLQHVPKLTLSSVPPRYRVSASMAAARLLVALIVLHPLTVYIVYVL